jgi:hypothetical protein
LRTNLTVQPAKAGQTIYRLLTTLLDPKWVPAEQLVHLHAKLRD